MDTAPGAEVARTVNGQRDFLLDGQQISLSADT